jgi:hypothetical protein
VLVGGLELGRYSLFDLILLAGLLGFTMIVASIIPLSSLLDHIQHLFSAILHPPLNRQFAHQRLHLRSAG